MATDFPIVALGSSAGGLEPMQAFFRTIAPDTPMGFVVIAHLSPDRESMLVEILRRSAPIPVKPAVDGDAVEPGSVHVIQPGTLLTIESGRLKVAAAGNQRPLNQIDIFFSSLAADAAERAIGIILSGTGSDGTIGVKRIKEHGGLSITQGADHSTPKHTGMPESVISAGLSDYILPPEKMMDRITAYLKAAESVATAIEEETPTQDPDAVRLEICALLAKQLGHDFSGYKEGSFMRRVQRRMQVLQIFNVGDYVDTLRDNPAEHEALFRDLLIGVTYFFRNDDAFESLEKNVIPELVEDIDPNTDVRVWVPGCATGEEVYSLAILLSEGAARAGSRPKICIFGSDLAEDALAAARAGRYPAPLLRGVSEERKERFFDSDGLTYTVRKELRKLCVFSHHNITNDPPFPRLDLISCRNLLIYFGSDLQQQLLPVFHYALRSGGFLFLGTSESVSRGTELFTPVDSTNSIFRRNDDPGRAAPAPILPFTRTRSAGEGHYRNRTAGMSAVSRAVGELVVARYVPPHVVVDRSGNIIHSSSGTGKYLELSTGKPIQQILPMARKELRFDLMLALKEAREGNRAASRRGMMLEPDSDKVQAVVLIVEPLTIDREEPLYVVLFDETGPTQVRENDSIPLPANRSEDDGRQLEQELHEMRERIQLLTEQYEISLNEARSTNEELLSLNEELQSANEELETSKEESQSMNEELQSVNADLELKMRALDTAHSDLQNVFAGTDIAVVFLDLNLRIRMFTPKVQGIFNLLPSDRGRPLTDITYKVDLPDLCDNIQSVANSGEPLERRVNCGDQHFLMRVLPYQGGGEGVEGTLVTFVDVSEIVHAEDHLRTMIDELNHRVRNMLTVIMALARLTARRTTDPEAFVEVFSGRLEAMATSYNLISQEGWTSVDLAELIRDATQAHELSGDACISLSGPPLRVNPKAALALGMVLHELGTNAVKYGALSASEGRVSIDWKTEQDEIGDWLVLRWRETDGPAVVAPRGSGYGTTLIEREVEYELDGTVDIRFDPDGVRAVLKIPMQSQSQLITPGAAAPATDC
ncbi:MAG: CheR family methyltransferase [Alphaproteobacteria bacterium]